MRALTRSVRNLLRRSLTMRCPDCQKFVSYSGDETPELDGSIELDESTGSITATVRIHKDCGECGTELKEATLELEASADDAFMKAHGPDAEGEHELQFDEMAEPEATETRDNPGRPARYQKTLFGATLDVTVTCSTCGDETHVTLADSVPASSLDECC
jgi:uncharacterized protein (DUF983 family)